MILTKDDLSKIVLEREFSTPLNVQYNQHSYAKKLGARWGGEKWVAPPWVNLAPLYHWLQQEDYEKVLGEIVKNFGDKPELGDPPPSNSIKELKSYISRSVWACDEFLRSSSDEDDLVKISEKESDDAGILDPLSDIKNCWNYAINPDIDSVKGEKITGKWMMFVDLEELTETWGKVVRHIRRGEWCGHAKCATLMSGRHFFKSRQRPIIVYTYAREKNWVLQDLKRLSLSSD